MIIKIIISKIIKVIWWSF